MSHVIVHKYVEPDFSNLKKNQTADCAQCQLAEKINLLEGGDGFLCKAALYDVATLQCFIPKEYE
jgi:hypothetical protein